MLAGAVYIGAILGVRSRRGSRLYLAQALVFVTSVFLGVVLVIISEHHSEFITFAWVGATVSIICGVIIIIVLEFKKPLHDRFGYKRRM